MVQGAGVKPELEMRKSRAASFNNESKKLAERVEQYAGRSILSSM